LDPPSLDPPSLDPSSLDPPSLDPPSLDPPSLDPPSVPANLVAPLSPPTVASSGLPLGAHSESGTRHASNLEVLLSRPATTFSVLDPPSLDPPSVCLPFVSQAKPAKKKYKLADLLNKPKPVTTFTLMDAPSLEPPSVCAIPLPGDTYIKKTQKKSGKCTGLGELLNKKPVLTFMVDAPSLTDPPSVSFHANVHAQKHKTIQSVKDGRMAGTHAEFAASAGLSKESDPWASSWDGLTLATQAVESKKTENKNAAATVVEEETSFPTWDNTGRLESIPATPATTRKESAGCGDTPALDSAISDRFSKAASSSKSKNKAKIIVGALLNRSSVPSKYQFAPSVDASANLDALSDSSGDVIAPLRGSNVRQALDSASFHCLSKKKEKNSFNQSLPQLRFERTFEAGVGDSKKKSSPTLSQSSRSFSVDISSPRKSVSPSSRAQDEAISKSDNVGVSPGAKDQLQRRNSRSKKSEPLSMTVPRH
jgi:hypothetical protein